MQIEITTPACLLLGLLDLGGAIGQLGITLQFPPIQLLARDSATLGVTGGRADLAARQAARFFAYHRAEGSPAGERGAEGAEIEIELAIPQFMGLGSRALMGLTVARALAGLRGLPADDTQALALSVGLSAEEALETHAFAAGGLLLIDDTGSVWRRARLADHDEAHDWVFVLVLPRVAPGTPDTLEDDRRSALMAATAHLDPATGRIAAEELWPAVERDDIAAFAQALAAIRTANDAALERAGHSSAFSADEQAIGAIMRAGGALAWGRTLTGLGFYGLIEGGGPSRELRRALTEHIGLFGGTVMATLADNAGAQQQS
jgi:predicted sugar kinase